MPSVDICVCTYRRVTLRRVLQSLSEQRVTDQLALRVIVADNDVTPSARFMVAKAAKEMRWPVLYLHAPAGNISIARNACLDHVRADWIACIDDDETAPRDWIATLVAEAEARQADVVFAPSQACYPSNAPRWMVQSDLHSNRPAMGRKIAPHTANALLRWHGALWQTVRFDPLLGKSGGEDTAFFAQVKTLGARFAATSRASVTEMIPPSRLSLRWLAKRRFREGQTHFDVFLRDAGWPPLLAALLKMTACLLMTMLCLPMRRISLQWALRGIRQVGVLFGRFSNARPVHYGEPVT